MAEEPFTGEVDRNLKPEIGSASQEVTEFSRMATQRELASLKRVVGPEAFRDLADKKLDISTEVGGENEVITYMVPYGNRVITLAHNPALRMVDVSFELVGDYLARKSGRLINDESFAVVSEKLQPGTIRFLKFMGDFLGKVSDDCRVRIIADERRMKLYKRFIDGLAKPNIVLSPKSFKIGIGELDNEY